MHGDLFEFFRNHRFNAKDAFAAIDPATGERQGDGLNRNQYGGTLGGPIRTDRIFFFGAYQGTKFRNTPSDLESFVPTAAMLAGDFSTFNSAVCGRAVTMRGGFVNNRVAPSALSPAALAIAARLPKPQDECGRVQYSRTRPTDDPSTSTASTAAAWPRSRPSASRSNDSSFIASARRSADNEP